VCVCVCFVGQVGFFFFVIHIFGLVGYFGFGYVWVWILGLYFFFFFFGEGGGVVQLFFYLEIVLIFE